MDAVIFDVGHGFCALLQADNGNTMLFDCGTNTETGFRPSRFLQTIGCKEVQMLCVSNYDEDHMADLPNLLSTPGLNVRCLLRNPSVNTPTLLTMKAERGPYGRGALAMARMMETYTMGIPPWEMPVFPGMQWRSFWNRYPFVTDENNLSVVTFVQYGNLRFVFPGDLQTEGWHRLLQLPDFRNELQRTNIFIASHHGRRDGYCKEVFDYCQPEVVVISDDHMAFDTQETTDLYSQHAMGVRFLDGTRRNVLTTRNDGPIWFRQKPGDLLGWVILPDRLRQISSS